jgi:hypothetical protein
LNKEEVSRGADIPTEQHRRWCTLHRWLRMTAIGTPHAANRYSINSSARPATGSGTVMPSAFAVLGVMITSTLVDCWTGRPPEAYSSNFDAGRMYSACRSSGS